MYIPEIYKEADIDKVKAFILKHSFGIIVTHNEGKSLATHIPLELVNKNGIDVIQAHISKANPQCDHLKNNSEVLCIFNGPHSYISSSWYDFEEVPTWNYVAVHIYGTLKIIEGDELMSAMKHLMDKYEKDSENPIIIEELSEKTMRQMNGILGFEININSIEAAYKLSQNRNDKNHQTIIDKLNHKENSGSNAIADYMKKEREHGK
ncbi:FMN-binding negative transcriptional regulator [Ichthyenterobacterium sp. W332]|uniref:FMN-binding negative transcriptional regulator n=1 Tax=Microcosmobacter mediterraneus TaxID=3075607 RepID=A0ABU2YJW7_9FLAO|nr:FMN-binding negative transcriptional regulator [Ichthyenterobacterium sp. W332]MDT0558327.1 FMN-binding negative transcriptional regulator [Ichthyenterobacterium sp. W332]